MENTVENGKIARNEQCFLPFLSTCHYFSQTYNCCLQTHSIWKSLNFVVWERVNPFPNRPWFLRVCGTGLLKTLREKEKLLVASNFSFSHSVFCSFGKLSAIFTKFKIVVLKLFEFGRV